MAKLLMITGIGSAKDLASGRQGAFYNTLEEFHKYWERVDIICPRVKGEKLKVKSLFGNVFVHISPWPIIFHPFWFLKKGLEIYKEQKFDLMTVHEFPPFYNGIGARLLWQKINPHTHFGQFLKKIFLPWQKSKMSVGVKVPYVLEIFHIPGHPRAASIKEVIYKFLFKLFIRFDASKAKAVRVMNPVRSLARDKIASLKDLGGATSSGMNQKQVPDFLVKAGVPRDKIIYIPAIYVDLDVFRPMNLTKEYDLIFVGRLEKNKGINLLIDALDILSKTYNLKPKTLIVGSGPLHKNLELKSNQLKTNIYFYGWARDSVEVAELINKSKILIMPSYNEGGPRVVLEAMACGVPVLATLVGIVSDVIKDKESGRIIDWNAKDIATKAKELLFNPEEYNKYRQSGLEIAKKFEKKAAIENYAIKLKEILG